MHRILIIEEDKTLNNGIALALKAENYQFIQASGMEEARKILKDQMVELVILGLYLSDEDTLIFLQELNEVSGIPVVLLSSRETGSGKGDRTEYKKEEAEAGSECLSNSVRADALRLTALRARVDTMLKKARSGRLQVYQSREYYFSFYKMEFSKNDRRLDLSRTEQRLLQLLVENRGLTLPERELLKQISVEEAPCEDEEALLEAVTKLREKLEDNPGAPRYIKTVCGIGYTWADGRPQKNQVF